MQGQKGRGAVACRDVQTLLPISRRGFLPAGDCSRQPEPRRDKTSRLEVNKLGDSPVVKGGWRNCWQGEEESLLPCLGQGGVGLPGLGTFPGRDPSRMSSRVSVSLPPPRHPTPFKAVGIPVLPSLRVQKGMGLVSALCPT